MKNKIFAFALFFATFFFLQGYSIPSSLENIPSEIEVHNRVLAKINGKVISVLDIMKKMDLAFYRRFPDLTSSSIARYQFYMNSWTSVLMDMIDDELIVADAALKKVEVTDGDVREEMETLFGPNVVLNIDKIGLTYKEAWDMLKKEIIVRRMSLFMVRSKATNQVHPKKIRQLYEEFAKKNKVEEKWHYRVLTIKSAEETKSNKVADIAYSLLEKEKVPFEKISEVLEEKGYLDKEVNVTLSEEYKRKDHELSLAHKAILQSLNIGNHSLPILQSTKKGSETIHRLFYLCQKTGENVTPFKEIEENLRKELTQAMINKENEIYIQKLRKHFGVTEKYLSEMIPDQFVPFTLK